MRALNVYTLLMTLGVILATQFLSAQYDHLKEMEILFLQQPNHSEFSSPIHTSDGYSYTACDKYKQDFGNKGHLTVMK